VLSATVAVAVIATLGAVPAGATATCGFADGVVSVALPADGDSARLTIGTGADAGRILFGVGDATATRCGTAATATTDTVSAIGADGTQSFRISLSGGPFAPGVTVEADGSSEIEFLVDLGEGTDDELTVAGDAVADQIVLGTGGLNVNAAESADDIDVTAAGVERFSLEGNAGNDLLSGGGGEGTGDAVIAGRLTLRGGEDNDTLTGGAGNDVLNGGPGSDHLDGGPGADTASYFGASAGVAASLDAGTATGGDGADTLVSLENLTGSAFADALTGDEGDNVLTGLEGDDEIEGLEGEDAAGYLLAPSGVTVDLAAGTATGGHGADTLSGIEKVLGSAFDDVLLGDTAANTLVAGSGDDEVAGSDGNDVLQGGPGVDLLRGDDGNDSILGQGGNDDVRGGGGNDALRGGGGDDALLGGAGNDNLRGGPMTDACDGGPGFDQIHSCEA
jgi:Ca2+-binding RTX toxin-like protein